LGKTRLISIIVFLLFIVAVVYAVVPADVDAVVEAVLAIEKPSALRLTGEGKEKIKERRKCPAFDFSGNEKRKRRDVIGPRTAFSGSYSSCFFMFPLNLFFFTYFRFFNSTTNPYGFFLIEWYLL